VIEACGLDRVVELKVRNGELVVAPARRPRQGWRERFATLGTGKERPLLGDNSLTEFDEKEWTW
jgi:antitoxin MazE